MKTLLVRLPMTRLPAPLGYVATVAIVIVAALLRVAMSAPLQNYPLILFFPAVFLSALLFDRHSGYLATALSAIIAAAVFVTPPGSAFDWQQMVPLAIFVAIGALMTWIIEALRDVMGRLAAAEQAKSLLLQELGHRTKNDLAIIASALRLQIRSSASPEVRSALESALGRVDAIARAQDRLRDDAQAGLVDLPSYLEALCAGLQNLLVEVRPVSVKVRCDALRLGTSKAVAIGLIVNELVVNALKYAFPSGRSGIVSVDVVEDRETRRLSVTVSDNGVGGPTDSESGLGSRLVRLLARQHGGDVERQSSSSGYEVTATLSLDPPA